MPKFESYYNIYDKVLFEIYGDPTTNGIEPVQENYGVIVAIKFTPAKVFYDILSEYEAKVYRNVDSARVKNQIKTKKKK